MLKWLGGIVKLDGNGRKWWVGAMWWSYHSAL